VWTFSQAYGTDFIGSSPQELAWNDGHIDLKGHLPSGFRSASHYNLRLRNQLNALVLEYNDQRTNLYIGRRYFASGEIVLTDRSELNISYQKYTDGGVDEIDYYLLGKEVPIKVGGSGVIKGDLPAAVLVHWEPNDDGRGWHAVLDGKLSRVGAAPEVYVPYVLPVQGALTPELLSLPLTVREPDSAEKPSLRNVECFAEIGVEHNGIYRVTMGDTRSVIFKSKRIGDDAWLLDLVLEAASVEQRDQVEAGDRSGCLGWKRMFSAGSEERRRFATHTIDAFLFVK
jgi:hypothetical protein